MAITFTCECGRAVQVGDEFGGQQGTCPGCGRTVSIPDRPAVLTSRDAVTTAPWQKPPPAARDDRGGEVVKDLGLLVTHAGMPIADDDDLFADAPPEIGNLFSAFTSLKKHQEPMAKGMRASLAALAFLVGIFVTGFIANALTGGIRGPDSLLLLLLISVAVSGVLAGIVWWWTGFYHTCSYVGAEGLASYYCSGDRANVARESYFLFRDATDLRTGLTRHSTNGIYTGTNYSFTWSNQRGNVIYTFTGRFSSKEGTPVFTDPYYFAVAAESAWSLYLFRNIDRMTTAEQLLFFGLTAGNYIQLGEGLFMLTQGGKTVELRSAQIEKMTIGDGVISVWEIGGKEGWFVNTGIHQFMYADLGNARFFMFALEKLLGIRF